MHFSDIIDETYFSMNSNKSRSFLTILGIVIGIGSVICMISIGQGSAQNIQSNIQSLGSNLLVVMPGFQRNIGTVVRSGGSATTLTLDDSNAIMNQIQNVEAVAPTYSSRKQVKTTQGTNTNTSIYGVDTAYAQVKSITLSSGSFITAQQNTSLSKVAVIGPTTSTDLFGENTDSVGKKIKIDNLEFTIIGVTQSKGGTGFGSSDDLIYVPLNTALRYFAGNNKISNINIQITQQEYMTQAQSDITDLLLSRHNISDSTKADFSIMNQADILSAMTSVTDTLTLLLAAIAGISLLVGGIGIMNMMLTTVTERTKEIGLRKSLGAKNNDISRQFLSESVALTFIGGVIGILIGYIASLVVTKYSGTTTAVTWTSVILAFGVSAGIGIIFGYYPARRAAKLNPIEALRFE